MLTDVFAAERDVQVIVGLQPLNVWLVLVGAGGNVTLQLVPEVVHTLDAGAAPDPPFRWNLAVKVLVGFVNGVTVQVAEKATVQLPAQFEATIIFELSIAFEQAAVGVEPVPSLAPLLPVKAQL